MVQFPLNHELRRDENVKYYLTHSTMRVPCYIVFEELGVIKVDEVAFSFMDDEIVGAEIGM